MFRKAIRFLSHSTVYAQSLLSNGPNYLIFFVTGRCNLRCPHCFYLNEIENSDRKKELTLDEITKIAKQSPLLYHITFTGGETFLRKDLDEIVKVFYRYSGTRSVTLTTNGSYPDKVGEKVEEIPESCPNLIVRVPLSLDGPQAVHDKMRGLQGTWGKALETYESLSEIAARYSNVKLDVTSVLTQENVNSIEDLVDYVKNNMTVDNHAINFPRGAMQNEGKIVPAEEKYREITQRSRDDRKRFKYRFPLLSRILIFLRDMTESVIIEVQKSNRMPFVCEAGGKLIEMNEYGELFPCEVLDTLIKDKETLLPPTFSDAWMGNVRDYDYNIESVLSSHQAQEVSTFIENGGCACSFECAIGASLVFKPTNIFRIGSLKSGSIFRKTK